MAYPNYSNFLLYCLKAVVFSLKLAQITQLNGMSNVIEHLHNSNERANLNLGPSN